MEPIGFCGGPLVLLVLLLFAIAALALVTGGILLVLLKLGVIVNRLGHPDERGESDTYVLEQSSAPETDKDHASN